MEQRMSNFVLDFFDQSSAVFSEDGLYRYQLRRTWGISPSVLWIMLNPSTADAFEDDPTIRRCMRFAQGWKNYGGIIVCNLFAFRSTEPVNLKKADDPIGPDNDEHIKKCAQEAGIIVCAWGNHGVYRKRSFDVVRNLTQKGRNLFCLGVSKKDQPVHPLYQPKSAVPVIFMNHT